MKKVLITSLLTACCFSAYAEKPNILFIMSDDHTSQAVGAYGGRLAALNPTPTIDQLAKEGALMENAFCINAICSPSRAAIMTGQYSAVNGVIDLDGALPAERQYLAREMKKAGYETAVIGKWHLHDKPEAFDYYKVLIGQGKYFDPVFYVKGQTKLVKEKGHSSDVVADSVLTWLKGRTSEKPFFLKFHFKAPHDMFQNAPRYDSYLEDVEIPMPESLFDSAKHGSIATRGANGELVSYIGTSVSDRNTRRNYSKSAKKIPAGKERTTAAYQKYLKKYLRCVKGVDDNLKRVLDYLKAEGLYDNTLIIYTGDQGFFLGEHDYIDKRWAYEEGMRMPFIVRYPKSIKAGTRSDAIVENVDYAPTMLDFAGVETPDYMQGKSFRSILETGVEEKSWKKAAYYHYWMHMVHHDNPAHIAIRTKRYKLINFYGVSSSDQKALPQTPPGWELYDLKTDPKEMNNVFDNPEYEGIIAELKTQLKELRAEYKEDDPKYSKVNDAIEDYWDYDEEDRQTAIELSKLYPDLIKKHYEGISKARKIRARKSKK